MMNTNNKSKNATSTKPSQITLANNQDISVVGKLRGRLVKCASRGTNVNLYANKVEAIDTATLQLLLAFVREIRNNGHKVQWQSPSESILNTAKLIGLDTELFTE